MIYAKMLREKLVSLSLDMRAIVDKAKGENNRGLTSEEAEKFDRLEADYTATEASIKRAEKVDTIEADLAAPDAKDRIIARLEDDGNGESTKDKALHAKAFSGYLRGGIEALDADQRQFMARRFIKNAQSTTTGSQGGYLVPTGFSDKLEEALKFFGGIAGVVGSFTTATGNPFPWPTLNDTANVGAIVGQNTLVAETGETFGQVNFGSYIFSSQAVPIPLALIEDSAFDIDAMLTRLLGTRLARIWNTKMTVGVGTTEPYGIVTAVVASGNTVQGAVGETTSIIYNDLVNLEHAVDPAYRNGAKYMFHDTTLKVLKQLKDASNRPLWQPGLTAGFATGAPSTILNHEFVINNDMPVMAASAASVLFGDMSKYMTRRVGEGTSVLRLTERYADYLQVGYIAFLRSDGNLLDAGTHPIAAFLNSAT